MWDGVSKEVDRLLEKTEFFQGDQRSLKKIE
jgi:hypothetical protein